METHSAVSTCDAGWSKFRWRKDHRLELNSSCSGNVARLNESDGQDGWRGAGGRYGYGYGYEDGYEDGYGHGNGYRY